MERASVLLGLRGFNGCHPGRSEAESREPLRCESHLMNGSRITLRVSGMTSGEHALVLRRAHASRAAQDEGYWAALRDSVCFLGLGVDLRLGQISRHGLCGIHRFTAADHLER